MPERRDAGFHTAPAGLSDGADWPMAADDRDAVADDLALKLWEPDALTAVEFYERLTAAYRRDHRVWAALNPPSLTPVVKVHEP